MVDRACGESPPGMGSPERSYGRHTLPEVVEIVTRVMNLEEKNAGGAKHPRNLSDRPRVVGVRQREATIDDVKALIWKWKLFGLAVNEADPRARHVRGVELASH